jgi:hypothetical protein
MDCQQPIVLGKRRSGTACMRPLSCMPFRTAAVVWHGETNYAVYEGLCMPTTTCILIPRCQSLGWNLQQSSAGTCAIADVTPYG